MTAYQSMHGPLPGPASFVQPRRTSKACSNCRHDKIRCDDSRPCAGCRRRGLSAAECVEGCEPCRRARLRCDGHPLSCGRCTALGLACAGSEPPRPVGGLGPVLAPDPAVPPRKNKLACKACTRDNKKCEDRRPCGHCVLRGEACTRVGRGPQVIRVRCQACRETNRRCEDARPCHFCVSKNCECVDPPRKGTGRGSRVKSACVRCRDDKVRCDGARPCQGCTRKGVVCRDRLGKGELDPSTSERPLSSQSSSSASSGGATSAGSHRALPSPLPFSAPAPHGSHTLPGIAPNTPESPYSRASDDYFAYSPPRRDKASPEVLPPLASVLGWAVEGWSKRTP